MTLVTLRRPAVAATTAGVALTQAACLHLVGPPLVWPQLILAITIAAALSLSSPPPTSRLARGLVLTLSAIAAYAGLLVVIAAPSPLAASVAIVAPLALWTGLAAHTLTAVSPLVAPARALILSYYASVLVLLLHDAPYAFVDTELATSVALVGTLAISLVARVVDDAADPSPVRWLALSSDLAARVRRSGCSIVNWNASSAATLLATPEAELATTVVSHQGALFLLFELDPVSHAPRPHPAVPHLSAAALALTAIAYELAATALATRFLVHGLMSLVLVGVLGCIALAQQQTPGHR
ncbi:uncharacterized protein AMSG_00117 [Thecamonas trahens ATCC 50062]|uniref:Uncharacterized protein n=1 Tax=Thecamonas trahens ATCC 50062 TaxID=461836 RepID=A0A0L0D0U7_THETB|nr:hypothetical protein AMSG_00117 [Thecamonas trahens ATCC 50062]KNC45999.1 hypothetical protein AMSG_00117 [Thecamonas trahens ATCC 50062]|eukprot:XP_013762979.1 hypothetical protein AMSG_00117 [Thecamonas trahens ATCC 50062]